MPRTNLLVILGLVATVAYLTISMRTGFIAHDEGLLGQAAERTLAGQVPHVDFNDPYTGGLSYLHATAFRVFGTRSSSLRIILMLFSVAFVIAFYRAAQRIVPPLTAVLVTFTAVAWSVKNYFAALPSWYNLFFATFGLLALLIDAERRQQGQGSNVPLWIAGLMGGCSILFKITGIFFVLAGLLYVLYDAHASTHPLPADRSTRKHRSLIADVCAWLAPPVTVVVLLSVMKHRLDSMDALHFLLPGTVVALVPWFAMRRRPEDQAPPPDAWFVRRSGLFLGGGVLPPLIFFTAYVAAHGISAATALYRGIFVLPQLRFGFAQAPLPPLSSLLVGAPLLLLFLPWVQQRLRGRIAMSLLVVGLTAVLPLSASHLTIYQSVWAALRPLIPFFVTLAVIRLLRKSPDDEQDRRLYLLAAVAGFASLIQYPYAFGIYFFYVAPLILLLMLDVGWQQPATRPVQACLFGFLLLFAVFFLNGAEVRRFGFAYQSGDQLALLAPERVNLWVPERQRHGYEAIAELVRRQTSTPDDIWAGPDAPEIYFFTGKNNPSRSFYDFFDPDSEATMLQRTAKPDIRLVVINRRPEFSPPISRAARATLAQRFPEGLNIGHMQVRWKSAPPPP